MFDHLRVKGAFKLCGRMHSGPHKSGIIAMRLRVVNGVRYLPASQIEWITESWCEVAARAEFDTMEMIVADGIEELEIKHRIHSLWAYSAALSYSHPTHLICSHVGHC
jgi:hypothetical protein